jgi:next-to-BRCA1 protein 1
VTLDSSNPSVYKQLYRAAKAKLKLRIKATIIDPSMPNEELQRSEPATPDHLTSHRYIPPMNPDPLKVAVPQPTVASLPEATPVSPIPSVQATENRLPSHIIARLPPIVPKSETTDAAKKDTCGEAPVPNAFPDQERVYPSFATKQPIALRAVDQSFHVSGATFTVCCNKCGVNIPDVHYHCSICQDGDYDLCHECVTNNVHCRVPGHFLIKRNIENGRVISSTTETVPKKAVKIETEKEVPGAFNTNTKEEQLPETLEMMIRTCNSCVNGKVALYLLLK